MDRQFPRLVIRRDKLRNNFTQIISRCRACGINVAGAVRRSWPPAGWSR